MYPATFTTFAFIKMLGEPAKVSSGRPSWLCPAHPESNPSFSLMPSHPDHKDRGICHACGFLADVYDVRKELFPDENWDQRRAVIAKRRLEYERQVEPSDDSLNSLHRGVVRRTKSVTRNYSDMDPVDLQDLIAEQEFSADCDSAIDELLASLDEPASPEVLIELLTFAQKSLEACSQFGLHPQSMAGRCGFESWTRRVDSEHMASCENPLCDWIVCRRKRGWSETRIRQSIARHMRKAGHKPNSKQIKLNVERAVERMPVTV